MPEQAIQNLFSLYLFSTGRRIFAHNAIAKIAAAMNLEQLVAHLDTAVQFDTELHAKEAVWRRVLPPPEIQPRNLDQNIDRVHSIISSTLRQTAQAFDPESQPVSQAQTLHLSLYPEGVRPLVQQSHIEQLADNKRVIQELSSPVWHELLQQLGLTIYLARLKTLNSDFDALLTHPNALRNRKQTYQEIQRYRRVGQEMLCVTVALIIAAFPTVPHSEERNTLMAPIRDQHKRIEQHLKRRRYAPEIDPNTGQEQSPTSQDEIPPLEEPITDRASSP